MRHMHPFITIGDILRDVDKMVQKNFKKAHPDYKGRLPSLHKWTYSKIEKKLNLPSPRITMGKTQWRAYSIHDRQIILEKLKRYFRIE